ncbi:MAG: hypothetical protein R8G66_11545 [Cytophagales bacterium]|nr:hypothetical protein [Cytophagales bacterium]
MVTFHRLILFALNLHTLKDFYTRHFGMEVTEEIPGEWVVLRSSGAEIALHKIGEAYFDPEEPFNASSNTKMVFMIDEDMVQFRQKLMDSHVEMREIFASGTPKYFYCDGEDPEGNVFQLMQKAPK